MRRIVSFFSSIRLLIPLLGLMGFVSIIGVVIPQHGEMEIYIRLYGGGFARFVTINGWDHIFSSVWFIVPLAMLCVNLLLCVTNRIVSLTRFFVKKEKIARGIIPAAGAIGSFAMHAGLLFLVAGGIVQYYRGATQMVMCAEGEKQPVRNFGFSITLRAFSIEKNANGAISNYRSEVELTDERDSLLRSGATMVNAPLSWKNYSLYQNTYGYLPDAFDQATCLLVDTSGDTLYSGNIDFGKPVPLKGGNRLVLCDRFICDFVLDLENRMITSRSFQHNNPAFHFVLLENDSTVASQWFFYNITRRMPPALGGIFAMVKAYTPLMYSGIEVRKKSGTGLIWTGIACMSLGLLAVFLFPMRSRATTRAFVDGGGSPSS